MIHFLFLISLSLSQVDAGCAVNNHGPQEEVTTADPNQPNQPVTPIPLTDYCKDDWMRFDRDNGNSICMQLQKSSAGISRQQAVDLCTDVGAKIVGVASTWEADWMRYEISSVFDSNTPYHFFIDGSRAGSCVASDSFAKRNAITWLDGFTTGFEILDLPNTEFDCSNGGKTNPCVAVSVSESTFLKSAPCSGVDEIARGVFCAYKVLLGPY